MISNNTSKTVVDLHVNGETRDVTIRSADTLFAHITVDLLTGAKRACENDCGAVQY